MYKKLKSTDSTNKMLEVLKEEGVFVISNYIGTEQTLKLMSEVDGHFKKTKSPYKFGKLYRGNDLSDYKEGSEIRNVFGVEWMRELSKIYHPEKPYGKSVIATHDYIKTNNWERQAWLHFDKKNSLKFLLYLTDVEDGCGGLTVCPKSHNKGRWLRCKWSSSEYEKYRRLEHSVSDIVNNYEITPILEEGGSLIVFDTDTFHKGGAIEEGKSRKIIRLHNK